MGKHKVGRAQAASVLSRVTTAPIFFIAVVPFEMLKSGCF